MSLSYDSERNCLRKMWQIGFLPKDQGVVSETDQVLDFLTGSGKNQNSKR